MRKSRNFRQGAGGGGGGGPRQSGKKALTTLFFFLFVLLCLVLSLFYRSQMVNFKEIIIFQGSGGGPNFSSGEGATFSTGGGGGSNCLFPIKTHLTCDFPRGSGPLVPPLDPHLAAIYLISQSAK